MALSDPGCRDSSTLAMRGRPGARVPRHKSCFWDLRELTSFTPQLPHLRNENCNNSYLMAMARTGQYTEEALLGAQQGQAQHGPWGDRPVHQLYTPLFLAQKRGGWALPFPPPLPLLQATSGALWHMHC